MEGITDRIQPYEGAGPYIFISYSHRDYARIRPILQGLIDRGYRLWYDEGIDPGTEWPESIANHLERSQVCIAVISPFSAVSRNCRREINFALSKNIDLLALYLEPTQISPGLQMQLSTHPSLMGYTYPDTPALLDQLGSLDALAPCRGPWDESSAARKPQGSSFPAPKKRSRAPWLIALVLLLAALGAGAWRLYGLRRQRERAPVAVLTTLQATEAPILTATSEPTAQATAQPTAEPTPQATPAPTPEPTPLPTVSPEPIPEGYTLLAQAEWEDGAFALCEKDEKTVYIQFTDGRIPYGYPFSEHLGNRSAQWEVWFMLQEESMMRLTLRAHDFTTSFETIRTIISIEKKTTSTELGSFRYTLKGTTFCFEVALPEGFTTKDVCDISVFLGTEDGDWFGYPVYLIGDTRPRPA